MLTSEQIDRSASGIEGNFSHHQQIASKLTSASEFIIRALSDSRLMAKFPYKRGKRRKAANTLQSDGTLFSFLLGSLGRLLSSLPFEIKFESSPARIIFRALRRALIVLSL
jgi:hypothetical protein